MLQKARKFLKALRLVAGRPNLLNHVLNNDEVWEQYVKKKYGMTQGLPVVELDDLFPGFEATVPLVSFLDGSSMPTDLALLMKLAGESDHCSYFEIGTWRGESVVNVAEVAAECFTLNLSDQEMRKLGLPEAYIAQQGFFSKGKKNITHLRGNSFSFDFAALNRKFDLIFIDGDHRYEAVKNDTQKVFRHLVHKNSVVVWHDYAKNPETIRHEVLAGILDGLPGHLHGNLYHVANTLSAVHINRPLNSSSLVKHASPANIFTVKINCYKSSYVEMV